MVGKSIWYGLLAIIPAMYGARNVQIGGDYLPGFAGGIVVIAIPFVVGEIIFFLKRRKRRATPAVGRSIEN